MFCLYPILFLYSQNINEVDFSQILLPAAVSLVFTATSLLLLNLLLKNGKKASLIVTIFLILFFSYGHVLTGLEGWKIKFLKNPDMLLTLWAVLLAAGVYLVYKTRRDLSDLTHILTVIVFALIVISTINIIVYQIKEAPVVKDNTALEANSNNNVIHGDKSHLRLRDIYYIILDAYAGSETLNKIYAFNNHEFTDYLTKKGFYVVSQSRSNYAVTFLSLASSLNMEYLNNYISNDDTIKSKDRSIPHKMINKNKVASFLRQHGYKFINFGSGWSGTDYNKSADLNISSGWYNEFMMVLIKTTELAYFNNYIARTQARSRIPATFSKLSEVHNIKGPKFIFAHITCPHPPYLFTAGGGMVDKASLEMDGREWGKKKLYLDQLNFINKQVKKLIDKILAQSKTEPIIILQADHGSASLGRPHPPLNLTDKKIIKKVRERMIILNAYYLPDGGNASLYDSITPVNTFRSIFNFYFGSDFPLLEDLSYYGDYDTPYVLTDVTEIVSTRN